jgi:hypothetical protein
MMTIETAPTAMDTPVEIARLVDAAQRFKGAFIGSLIDNKKLRPFVYEIAEMAENQAATSADEMIQNKITMAEIFAQNLNRLSYDPVCVNALWPQDARGKEFSESFDMLGAPSVAALCLKKPLADSVHLNKPSHAPNR